MLKALQSLPTEPKTITDHTKLDQYCQEQQELEREAEQLYNRWEELENAKNGG